MTGERGEPGFDLTLGVRTRVADPERADCSIGEAFFVVDVLMVRGAGTFFCGALGSGDGVRVRTSMTCATGGRWMDESSMICMTTASAWDDRLTMSSSARDDGRGLVTCFLVAFRNGLVFELFMLTRGGGGGKSWKWPVDAIANQFAFSTRVQDLRVCPRSRMRDNDWHGQRPAFDP